MELTEVRELFPHIKSGKIYFNHAASGPLSSRVLQALQDRLYVCSETKIDDYHGFLEVYERTRKGLGELINASPERIAFCDNTTNGLNIIAQGVQWRKGDRVILNDIEFPANVYPFLNLKDYGVEIDFVKSDNGIVSAEAVIDMIKPETRLISISFVQFLSGYRADMEKIGKECRKRDIIFCVDAIQGLGALRLDVNKCNIDFISCGTQKWMLNLQGLAFIFIRKDIQERLKPKYVGWLGVEGAWDLLNYNLKLKSTADAFFNGTVNTLAVFGLDASLKLFKEYGFDKVEQQVIRNAGYLIKQLTEIGLEPVLKDCPIENLSGIISFRHPYAQSIFEELTKKDIHTAIREGMLRISPHFYNTREEIDILIENLKTFL